jgi:hypothetical protein
VPRSINQTTIAVREPLAHVRRDFVALGIRLDELATPRYVR